MTHSLLLLSNSRETSVLQRSVVIVTAILAFLLSGMSRLNLNFGFPLYATDLVILFLVLKSFGKEKVIWIGHTHQIIRLLTAYFCLTILGELHGALVYGKTLESAYMLLRVCLAIAITFVIPKQIQSLDSLKLLLKGVLLGLILTASLSVCFSFPFTRELIEPIFSIKMIVPNSDQIVNVSNTYYEAVYNGSYRGLTLLGASTTSAGVMATLWPLTIMGLYLFRSDNLWRKICIIAIVIIPLGILSTYGRFAWTSVVLVTFSFLLWNSIKGRATLALVLLCVSLLIVKVGADSISENLPLVNRIVAKTQVITESPTLRESEAERFLAYTEPFSHVMRHPSFFFIGSGIAQRRWGGNVFEEATTASHAVPGMAYYAYGFGGTFCQVGIMLTTFRLIYSRLKQSKRNFPGLSWIWRVLLASWCGLLPWWCFGHGIVTEPRCAMVFFFFIGVILACDQIFLTSYAKCLTSQHAK
jgi:hypothetical protein